MLCSTVTGSLLLCIHNGVVTAGVQVSLEDAEILMGTAERTNVIGHPTYAPYKVIIPLFPVLQTG